MSVGQTLPEGPRPSAEAFFQADLRCPHCGYNLRGLAIQEGCYVRCPECATVADLRLLGRRPSGTRRWRFVAAAIAAPAIGAAAWWLGGWPAAVCWVSALGGFWAREVSNGNRLRRLALAIGVLSLGLVCWYASRFVYYALAAPRPSADAPALLVVVGVLWLLWWLLRTDD